MPEKVLSDQTRRDTMKKNDRRNTMYDTCIFDLYGTLVDIRTDEDKQSSGKGFPCSTHITGRNMRRMNLSVPTGD